jgi:hypothetical protein
MRVRRSPGLSGVVGMALVAWLVGEVTFTLVHNTWPGLSSFMVLVFVYFVVKITGDILCLITRRAQGEWGYFDDYLLNELAIGWTFFALPLSIAQSVPMLLYPIDSLPWRIWATAAFAALIWGVMRRKKEYEATLVRPLGRRVRAKYGLGGDE